MKAVDDSSCGATQTSTVSRWQLTQTAAKSVLRAALFSCSSTYNMVEKVSNDLKGNGGGSPGSTDVSSSEDNNNNNNFDRKVPWMTGTHTAHNGSKPPILSSRFEPEITVRTRSMVSKIEEGGDPYDFDDDVSALTQSVCSISDHQRRYVEARKEVLRSEESYGEVQAAAQFAAVQAIQTTDREKVNENGKESIPADNLNVSMDTMVISNLTEPRQSPHQKHRQSVRSPPGKIYKKTILQTTEIQEPPRNELAEKEGYGEI